MERPLTFVRSLGYMEILVWQHGMESPDQCVRE